MVILRSLLSVVIRSLVNMPSYTCPFWKTYFPCPSFWLQHHWPMYMAPLVISISRKKGGGKEEEEVEEREVRRKGEVRREK